MTLIDAWVAPAAKARLERRQIDLGALSADDVEVQVDHCGVCHSDLSMLNNDWNWSQYPAVFGHEVVGRITAVGSAVRGLAIGQRVGVGWTAGSCMHCRQCMSGDHHMCRDAAYTIVGHNGGFASRVRAHWAWAIPLPEKINYAEAGPLLCGGITVFDPIMTHARPTDRVGIVGIGGLGHMGVKFARAYGCEVTAFTSSPAKFDEARGFGAHHVVSSRDSAAIQKLAGSLNLLIVTVNVPMDWDALIGTLAPHGRIHIVGAVLEPIPVNIMSMMMKQASLSASPTGSPVAIADMLEFAARHAIAPQTEHMPMSRINEAMEHLHAGKARYRIVLDADF